jgi:DNA-binding LytR/AlgR family response regulator
MKAIIIEDEKLSAEHLSNLLKRIDASIHVIAYFDSVKKTISAFEKGIKADVLFVDVHLADGLSFEIFSKINIITPVIFTTAYDDYAIKAFKLNSVDYLLKPIGLEDLRMAIDKFKKMSQQQFVFSIEHIAAAYQTLNKPYKNRFMVKLGEQIVSVKVEDISLFVSEEGTTMLTTNAKKRYAIDFTLDQLEDLVSPEVFFRINRQVLIHINAVQKISTYFNSRLKLSSELLKDDQAVISRERVNEFKAWLDK